MEIKNAIITAAATGQRTLPLQTLVDRDGVPKSALRIIIEEVVDDLAKEQRWRLNPVGALDLLPAPTSRRLKEAADATRDVEGMIVNVAHHFSC